MVWVHTCVFPFNSELCAVRCGTHSTIRGVHTLFTPIDIQHAATEGHLGRREEGGEKEREKVSHRGSMRKQLHVTLLTKATTQIVVFSCCEALFSIDQNEKEASGVIRALQRRLSAPRPLALDFPAGSCSIHVSLSRTGQTQCCGHNLLPCSACLLIFYHKEKPPT